MSEFQKITNEITQLQIELNHLGRCTTKGLSTEQIAQLDEHFFGFKNGFITLKMIQLFGCITN
ncbi:hypothetical protein [Acinetobacter pittii]|uniref:hypothetical protein n=1 Tax=Acinetobacter pittii TaxID=48296 RepID=UPI0024DF068F|nr:hypothetical protein [Acinetobacter pittii]